MVFVKKVIKRSFKHNALIVANIYIFIDNTNNKKNIFKHKLPFITFVESTSKCKITKRV